MPSDDAQHDLRWFEGEVARLAAIIAAPAGYLPTYGRTEDFARPHIEFDGARFHFVVVERGQELDRKSSANPDEILYHVFDAVTHQMASGYECRHRRAGEDSRRQLFDVYLQLLGKLSPTWRERARTHLNEVLRRNPFNDRLPTKQV